MKLRGGLVLLLLAGCASTALGEGGGDGDTPPSDKVFVCKYVGTPGVDEVLQTGQNPISVSVNAIPLDPVEVGSEFADAQGRSVVIAFDVGQPEPSPDDCPPPTSSTTTTVKATTTTVKATTTTAKATTTTQPNQTTTTTGGGGTTTTTMGGGGTTTTTQGGGTTTTGPTTTFPTPSQFSFPSVTAICPNGVALISITFPSRPELNGQVGTLTFSTGGSTPLTFISGATVQVPYPASAGTGPVTLTYTVAGQTATPVTLTFPANCAAPTTTTTTPGGTTTTGPSTTTPTPNTFAVPPGATTTTVPGIGPPPVTTPFVPFVPVTTAPPVTPTTLPPGVTAPPTTAPPPFTLGGATTVCVSEVPTIRITFQTPAQFPELVGRTGTLTMADVNGNVVSSQPLVYRPGTTVDLLYPGTTVNPDGSIDDVPGWILTDDGLWIRDPSDAFLREGIRLTYTVNPTATAFVTYPPESSACANPDGPFTPSTPGLPPTR